MDGFNLETATLNEFVETCKRAKTNEAIDHGTKRSTCWVKFEYNSNQSQKKTRRCSWEREPKKTAKKSKHDSFYCKYHKSNDSHNMADCKVLNNRNREDGHQKNRKDDYKKDKNKYQKKYKELHVMQEAFNAEKAKYWRAWAKYWLAKNGSGEESDNSDKKKSPERSMSGSRDLNPAQVLVNPHTNQGNTNQNTPTDQAPWAILNEKLVAKNYMFMKTNKK